MGGNARLAQRIHPGLARMVADVGIKELRKFGLVFGAIIALLFGALFPWLFGNSVRVWPWAVGGVLAVWALVHPASLKPVFRSWMAFGNALGWVNSRLILGFAFLVIILPTSIAMRLLRLDPMARRFDKTRSSYRVISSDRPHNHFEKPF